MTGIRDARADGFKSKTHGGSGTGTEASIGSTVIAGDGPSPRRWPEPKRPSGTRDAGGTGFKSETNGSSATSMETYTGVTAKAGDGLPAWPQPMRTTCGIRDAGATGLKRRTDGDFGTAMATCTDSAEIAGNGTTDVVTARKAASTTTAHLAIIEPTKSSSNRK